jgi:hypothetical protein
MKSTLLLFSIFILSNLLFSQEVIDTTLYKWIPKGSVSINASQVSFSNWAQGGTNSFAWVGSGKFGLYYKSLKYALKNDLKLTYGRVKLGDESYRTNENELYLEDVYTYLTGWKLEPYVSNLIRTAITTGYNYKDTPFVKIADFFDPGYVTQSAGFEYSPKDYFSSRLGFALQETFTNKYRSYSDDPDTKDKMEAFKFETGIESVTDLLLSVDKNLLLDTKLRLFTRFKNPDVWDVRWDNTLTAKINDYFNVNLNVLLLYEKSQSPKTQLKEALLLGFTYTVF